MATVENETQVFVEFREKFDNAVPQNIRDVLFELMSNPDWLEISTTLYNLPPAEHVDRDDLFKAMNNYLIETNGSYSELNDNLKRLKEKGYLIVRQGSENFYLTKKSADAIEVFNTFREEIVEPIVDQLKHRPECKNMKGLDRIVISEIARSYSKISPK